MPFIPPVEERETGELTAIANCTNNGWQAEAIRLAAIELQKRNNSGDEKRKIIKKWNSELNAYLKLQEIKFKLNENEDYSMLNCILIFILSPFTLPGKITYGLSVSELKEQHYFRKENDDLLYLFRVHFFNRNDQLFETLFITITGLKTVNEDGRLLWVKRGVPFQ
ncbi:MAG: hypothetical protein V1775_11205 [Bacteroidota bacterium]